MESFQDLDCMTIERIYKKYLNSKGDREYRIVELEFGTVDLKLRVKYGRGDALKIEMHRLIYRGKDHIRGRPESERFIVGSESDSLTKTKIFEGQFAWLGLTWLKSNNYKNPSLNQIEAGLIEEAMKRVEKMMGSVAGQLEELKTKDNIKQTWEKLLGLANIHGPDRDKPLEIGWEYPVGLTDAAHPVTMLLLFIY